MIDSALQVAQIVSCTEAEGPGKRYALWFQGCPLRCKGCCNPEMLSYKGGTQIPLYRVLLQIYDTMKQGIEGVTLLGGEPTSHSHVAAKLAKGVQRLGLSVMVFSGYTLPQLKEK